MKASELRDVLAGLMQKHGDLDVVAWNDEYGDALGLVQEVAVHVNVPATAPRPAIVID